MTHRLSLSNVARAWLFAPANQGAAVRVAEWLDELCEDPTSKAAHSVDVPRGALFCFVEDLASAETGLVAVTYTLVSDPAVVRVHKIVCARDVPMM